MANLFRCGGGAGDDFKFIAPDYDPNITYNKTGINVCTYDGLIYLCESAEDVRGPFDKSKWSITTLAELSEQNIIVNKGDYRGKEVETNMVETTEDNTFFGVPQAGYYDETSKIFTSNSNLSGSRIISLGNVTSFNVKTSLPNVDYTRLTANNFLVISNNAQMTFNSDRPGVAQNALIAVCHIYAINKTYDSKTGILTVPKRVVSTYCDADGIRGRVNSTMEHTVYLIIGDIETIS